MQLDNVEDIYPLTPTQQGILFHCEAMPASGVYIEQICSLLSGDLVPYILVQAWQKMLQKHACLRTAFVWNGLDEPLQIVRAELTAPWVLLNWSDKSPSQQQQGLKALLAKDRCKGFELANAPLLRFTLIRLSPSSYQFIWSFHHLLLDGWSSAIVLDELWHYCAKYRKHDFPYGSPPAFKKYIAWLQAKPQDEKTKTFWSSYLKGFNKTTDLALANNHKPPTKSRNQVFFCLSQAETQSLTESAKLHRLTLNTLVQAAWANLLQRYSGDMDIVFGTTVSGRPAELEGVETMVGLFINSLPVRAKFDVKSKLLTWLLGLQDHLVQTRRYENAALADIKQWSELAPSAPLFNTLTVFENYPPNRILSEQELGFSYSAPEYLEQSHYPLALLVVPGDEITLMFNYDTRHFSKGKITQLSSHVKNLLTNIPHCLDQPVLSLPMLTSSDRRALTKLAGLKQHKPNASPSIPRQISQQAKRCGPKIAVKSQGRTLTYSELAYHSDMLAATLHQHRVNSGDRVAICLARGVELIPAMLAVLHIGATYIPLDPNYPQKRLDMILADADPKLIITTEQLQSHLQLKLTNQLWLDKLPHGPMPLQKQPEIQPEQLAYIIYTSGSTGKPKGVMVSHHNLRHSTAARFDYYHTDPSVFLLLSSFAFDSSVAGIFWVLCSGGMLVISEPRLEQDMGQLRAYIAREKISHLLCLPTLYEMLLTHEPASGDTLAHANKGLHSLQTVIVAGEEFPGVALIETHQQTLPRCQLFNEYGPTEACVWSTVFNTRDQRGHHKIPIGKPIPGTQVYLLNATLEPVPEGAIGEIYIGGNGVTQGYLNQPADTSFMADPFSSEPGARMYKSGDLGRYDERGNIEFLGRKDRQIKIRGHRIEPGEVEAALALHPQIKQVKILPGNVLSNEAELQRMSEQLDALSPEKRRTLMSELQQLSDQKAAELVAILSQSPRQK